VKPTARFVKQRGISETGEAVPRRCQDRRALVNKAQEGGKQYTITGTPTFILNGAVVEGAASWELLRPKLSEAGL
jgi:protein-disulfide isomerase